jgi:hypothetical protein
MTYYVMKIVGLADGTPMYRGQYLEWYDPERPASKELAGFTRDITKAKRFPSLVEFHAEWTRVRKRGGGLRDDGRPDRPLTAFTVEMVTVEED